MKGELNKPIASCSELGWMLSEKVPFNSFHVTRLSSLHIYQDDNLDNILQKFWLQEEITQSSIFVEDEQKCEEHFTGTHKRNKQGCFLVRLPFKNVGMLKSVDLRSSFYSANKMLLKKESRFEDDHKLMQAYDDYLGEYEELGHMTRLNCTDGL